MAAKKVIEMIYRPTPKVRDSYAFAWLNKALEEREVADMKLHSSRGLMAAIL